MDPVLLTRKYLYGLFYGLAGGLGFSLLAWALDSILLSNAHAGYPWAYLVPGFVGCTLFSGLVGWLSVRLQRTYLAVIFWLLAAIFFVSMAILIPFRIAPYIISQIDPGVSEWVDSSGLINISPFIWLSLVVVVIAAIAVASFENSLIEQAVYSNTLIALLPPIIGCFLLFGLAGFTSDFIVNAPLRDPIISVNSTIQFAIDNQGKVVEPTLAHSMNLGSINNIRDMITKPRHLYIGGIDRSGNLDNVYVDFNGNWATCYIYDGHPYFCKKVDTP